MHRFFIPEDWIYQDEVLVKGGQARQIFQVLRLKPKDHILVLDNSGWEYEVEIDKVSGGACQSTTNPSILLWEGEESTGISTVLKNPTVQNS